MNASGAGRHAPPALPVYTATLESVAIPVFVLGSTGLAIGEPVTGMTLLKMWIVLDTAMLLTVRATPNANTRVLRFQAAANTPLDVDFGPYGIRPAESGGNWVIAGSAAGNILAATFVLSSENPNAWKGETFVV